MPPIRVIIADDHPIVRNGIRNELDPLADIVVIGEATNTDEVEVACARRCPDVLLLDFNMPGRKMTQLIADLDMTYDDLHILILTAYKQTEFIRSSMKAGANGFILKDEEPDIIPHGIRLVAKGGVWLSNELKRQLLAEKSIKPLEDVLSEREIQIFKLVAAGRSNQEISEELMLAEGTIKNYVSSIYNKLDVKSRREAIAYAWREGVM